MSHHGLTFWLAATVALAAPMTIAAESPKTPYQAKTDQGSDGKTLPYRLLTPETIEQGKQYPLVLFLHGAGERGRDNAQQLRHGAGEFAKPDVRRKYPCFVVAPQCPPESRWVEVDWALAKHTMPKKVSGPLGLSLDLVEKLAAKLPVDRQRIYVTGLSMGGFGTWEAPLRRPGLFAAAMPICGGGDVAQATKLVGLPIWAFHGDRDPTVVVSRTKDMVEAIRQAGGTAKATIYPGVEHDCWTTTYADPNVLAWLFSQKKP